MRTLKLSSLQQKKLTEAIAKVNALNAQFRAVQTQLNEAANHRNTVLEMIYEVHGIDRESLDESKCSFKDGVLSLAEKSASERIKKTLSKTQLRNATKTNGHDKVKA